MAMRKKIFIFVLISLCFAILFKIISGKGSMSVEGYVSLGNEMGVKGKHLEAGKAFKNALKIDPYYIPAYLGLGTAYGNAGRGNWRLGCRK